ncbi:hypothetical protein ACWFR5_10300 [Streptomyces sp. NPDC055092]
MGLRRVRFGLEVVQDLRHLGREAEGCGLLVGLQLTAPASSVGRWKTSAP